MTHAGPRRRTATTQANRLKYAMDDVIIRNRCAYERIDHRFLPLVEAARDGMLACSGARARALYLQGSIARGEARVGLADLDMLVLLEGSPAADDNRCLADLAASLGAATVLVSRFDLETVDANALEPFRRFVLSSDSLCVYGADSLTRTEQLMGRLPLAQLVTPDPSVMLPDYLAWVEELATAAEDERRFASRIIGKDLLKLLRGVALLRGAPFEVDIAGMAAQFESYVPEAAEVAEHLFALYVDPTTDLVAIRRAASEAAVVLGGAPELSLLHDASDEGTGSPGDVNA
ncbi:MAG: nucleotidyltransferase domain-containing protein [Thermomicrobiales bacterium]